MLAAMRQVKPGDRVYSAFDIEIDTNSTLPMDQQSKANMMMKLASLQLTPNSPIDRKALLDVLQVPEGNEIDSRMNELVKMKQQMASMAQQGGPPNGQPAGG